MTTWAGALDSLEERVRRQEDVVEGRANDAPSGGLPTPEGPMPAELADRARVLLARMADLEARGDVALTRLRQAREQRQRATPYVQAQPHAEATHSL